MGEVPQVVDTETAGLMVPLGGGSHVPEASVIYGCAQSRCCASSDRFWSVHRRQLNQAIFTRLYIEDDEAAGHRLTNEFDELLDIQKRWTANTASQTQTGPPQGGPAVDQTDILSKHALGVSEDDVLSAEQMVEAIRRNSTLAYMSRKWRDLHERIRSSPLRSFQSDPDNPPPRSRRFLTAEDAADIVQAYEAGQSTQCIGSCYGISKTRVATVLREQGVSLRRQGLTDEQVSEAAQLYEAGKSLATLGTHFDVSHATIGNALKRRGIRLRPRPGW